MKTEHKEMVEITKTEIFKSSVGDKKGWAFSVSFRKRPYPNLVSALFKTELGAKRKLSRYLKTGHIDFYGNAE